MNSKNETRSSSSATLSYVPFRGSNFEKNVVGFEFVLLLKLEIRNLRQIRLKNLLLFPSKILSGK